MREAKVDKERFVEKASWKTEEVCSDPVLVGTVTIYSAEDMAIQ